MKTLLYLVCLLLILHQIIADPPTTETHPDYRATVEMESTKLLNRVEKKALVTYAYTLNKNHLWTQFPDMAISFYLPFDQYVQIKYNIQTVFSGIGWFGTRVKIDGKQNIEFRIFTGDTRHHSHVISDQVWLPKGHHSAVLDYKANNNVPSLCLSDWNVAVFKVKYYQL